MKWLADDRMKMIENNCRPKRLTRFESFKWNSYNVAWSDAMRSCLTAQNPIIGVALG